MLRSRTEVRVGVPIHHNGMTIHDVIPMDPVTTLGSCLMMICAVDMRTLLKVFPRFWSCDTVGALNTLLPQWHTVKLTQWMQHSLYSWELLRQFPNQPTPEKVSSCLASIFSFPMAKQHHKWDHTRQGSPSIPRITIYPKNHPGHMQSVMSDALSLSTITECSVRSRT